jgi:hypothetical protein
MTWKSKSERSSHQYLVAAMLAFADSRNRSTGVRDYDAASPSLGRAFPIVPGLTCPGVPSALLSLSSFVVSSWERCKASSSSSCVKGWSEREPDWRARSEVTGRDMEGDLRDCERRATLEDLRAGSMVG